jgi:hypothetical protein
LGGGGVGEGVCGVAEGIEAETVGAGAAAQPQRRIVADRAKMDVEHFIELLLQSISGSFLPPALDGDL